MAIAILMVVVIVEIIAVSAVSGDQNNRSKGLLVGGCIDIVSGAIMRVILELKMGLADEKAYETLMKSYEDLLILQAAGLLFMAGGFVMVAFAIYNCLNDRAEKKTADTKLPPLEKSNLSAAVKAMRSSGSTMCCPVCGVPHDQAAQFCSRCGTTLS